MKDVWHELKNPSLSPDEDRVLDFLFTKGISGASHSDVACELNMLARRAGRVLRRLELIGEAFRKDRAWVATSSVISTKIDPKRVVELMRAELERALFGDDFLSDGAKAFLEEYAAARKLGQPPEVARRFAQQRLLESTPSLPLEGVCHGP